MKFLPQLMAAVLGRFYDLTWRRVRFLGAATLLARDTVVRMLTPPMPFGEIVRQMELLAVQSVTLTAVIALFTGMVLALQSTFALEEFGAKLYMGEVVAISLVRELGPVLTALMVGGRVGAGITAELGSMTVTEQVEALRSLGADPVRKLVVPRMWALLVGLPLLTVLADVVGILGGMLISIWEVGLGPAFYFRHALRLLDFGDFFSGFGKSFFFAFDIGLIACFNGLRAEGGANGVGRVTTETVVGIAISVLTLDFFLTKLFLAL
ncbi:MAG: ABC transporter permease [Thermoanaerobaculum sp.]|nr:ABC transporter permease [Thermoanaerobaculum sp.]